MVFIALASLSLQGSYLDRTLVVINADSPVAVAIGADYMKQRGVKNRLLVHCQDSSESGAMESVAYAAFHAGVEMPLRAYLAKHPGIDFILLTKGMPIRIQGAPGLGLRNDTPSLDSFIAALDYDKQPGAVKAKFDDSGFKGTAWANRFWNSHERFSHAKFGGYLVTRLDGYTEDDARLLTRYSLASERQKPDGSILLDAKSDYPAEELKSQPVPLFSGGDSSKALTEIQYKHYEEDLVRAGGDLKMRGLPVVLDKSETFVTGTGLMGYSSWGSNDPKFNPENYKKLRFAPGGIAETAVSTSGRTFLPTTGGQSLIADLIQGRVTGVKGYCDEPFLNAIASPTILFDRYTRGWTLAESFYAASRMVGWEDIVIGDPICQPYGR